MLRSTSSVQITLCKDRRPHHRRRGICRGIHAKALPPYCWPKKRKVPRVFPTMESRPAIPHKVAPLALTMQGWHTDLFVRIRGRTVTSAGGFDKFTLAVRVSFWTKYEYCWVSISYWKIIWIWVAENERLRGARQRLDGEKRNEGKKIPLIFSSRSADHWANTASTSSQVRRHLSGYGFPAR